MSYDCSNVIYLFIYLFIFYFFVLFFNMEEQIDNK